MGSADSGHNGTTAARQGVTQHHILVPNGAWSDALTGMEVAGAEHTRWKCRRTLTAAEAALSSLTFTGF
jgi:hypothetical protein